DATVTGVQTCALPIFQRFPDVLFAETERTKIDHCLALAQAEVESEFRHDAVGDAGEVGLFQTLPSTAALFESTVGPFKRPVLKRSEERREGTGVESGW